MARVLRTLLLLLTLLVGQSHLCAHEYVKPSGQVCETCRALDDAPKPGIHPGSSRLQASHGDCHDCCTIRSCDNDSPTAEADFKPAPSFPAILPPPLVFVLVIATEFRDIRPPSVELYLPHGPPCERSARAPPVSFV